jgi:hypothetical protein
MNDFKVTEMETERHHFEIQVTDKMTSIWINDECVFNFSGTCPYQLIRQICGINMGDFLDEAFKELRESENEMLISSQENQKA